MQWVKIGAMLATALPIAAVAQAPPSAVIPAPEPSMALAAPVIRGLAAGTPVQLMVVNEVSTKVAKPGDRFLLRVNAPVLLDSRIVIPVGTRGYGEVLNASGNGATGHAGRLAARLLYLEIGGRHLRLRGEAAEAGAAGTTANVLGVILLGWAAPLALLSPGNNAKLKAGQLLTSTLDQPLVLP